MISSFQLRLLIRLVALGTLGVLISCGSRLPSRPETSGMTQPTPTDAALFGVPPTALPLLVSPEHATDGSATGDPATGPTSETLPKVVIYDDALNASWTLTQSTQVTSTLQSREFVAQGRYALKATKQGGVGILYFTVQRGNRTPFRRDKVLGLHFRLSGGRSTIPNDALLVTVVGSNRQPYWVPNDTSVRLDGLVTDNTPLFSETRLYFLGVNHTIPAKAWVDVFVWLDDLIYDPIYTYITGFYLKTDLLDYFYLDDINLILVP